MNRNCLAASMTLALAVAAAPIAAAQQAQPPLCAETYSLSTSALSDPPFVNADRYGYGNVKPPPSLGSATLCIVAMDRAFWRDSLFCNTREVLPERAESSADAERFAPMRAERDRLAELLKTCPQFAGWTYKAPERDVGYGEAVEDHSWTNPETGVVVAARALRFRQGSKGRYSVGYKAGVAFVPPKSE